ncbi:MAG: hypothetical protein ACI8Y7_000074 [Candidatus Woesearchaeota archaeon]|jgi:hypothetical protein
MDVRFLNPTRDGSKLKINILTDANKNADLDTSDILFTYPDTLYYANQIEPVELEVELKDSATEYDKAIVYILEIHHEQGRVYQTTFGVVSTQR